MPTTLAELFEVLFLISAIFWIFLGGPLDNFF